MSKAEIYALPRKIIGFALADGFHPSELLAYQSFIDFVKNDGENSERVKYIKLVLGSYEDPVCYIQFGASMDGPDLVDNLLYLSEYSRSHDKTHDEVYREFYDRLMLYYSTMVE